MDAPQRAVKKRQKNKCGCSFGPYVFCTRKEDILIDEDPALSEPSEIPDSRETSTTRDLAEKHNPLNQDSTLNAYSANNNDYAQDPLNDSTGVEDRQNQIQVSREPPKSQTFPNKAIFSSRERQARLAFANNNRTRRTPEPLNRSQLPLGSVVVVECTSTSPSFISPWRYRDQQRTVGSGFVIMGRRILTNAHVVRNAVRLRVQKYGSAEKFQAAVVAISMQCDLAVLKVVGDSHKADAFWQGLIALEFSKSKMPELYDTVSVIGFPSGGQTICVTKGVVSRIDMQTYNRYSSAPLLITQIDAAINPGNSGGPAVDTEGRVVGIAFLKRTTSDADNIGYLIPAIIAKNFLHKLEVDDGNFAGVPELGFDYQSLDNPSLRRAMGMEEGQSGVLVVDIAPLGALSREENFRSDEGDETNMENSKFYEQKDVIGDNGCISDGEDGTSNKQIRIDSGSDLIQGANQKVLKMQSKEHANCLRIGDIVLQVDGYTVANDGTVEFRANELLRFDHLVTCKAEGQTSFQILRNGNRLDITAIMRPVPSPAPRSAQKPEYFMIGGLVFTALSGALVEEYMTAVGSTSITISDSIIKSGFSEMKQKDGKEIIILLRILAHEVNYGYGSSSCVTLSSINGVNVRTLFEAADLVTKATAQFLKFQFKETKRLVVLETASARKAETEILALHGIPSSYSPGLLKSLRAPAVSVPCSPSTSSRKMATEYSGSETETGNSTSKR